MHADFAVVDDAALALVNEFNRIFYRYDMVLAGAVGFIDDGRQRRRFAGARRPGHQNQSARQLGQFGQHRRKCQLFAGQNLAGNFTEDGGDAVLLLKKLAR